MSWAEIKKAINSDLSTPLNSQLTSKTNELANMFGLKFEEVATISGGTTFSRDYDAIVVPASTNAGTIYKGTNDSGLIMFYKNSDFFTPFIKIEKNTDYYFKSTNSLRFVFYRLGGGYLTFLKALQAQTLRKGVC